MAFLQGSARFSLVEAFLLELVSITLPVAIPVALKNTFANQKLRGIMKAKPFCLFVVSTIFLGEIALASPTLAADSWLPVFVPDQHTYVAPVINNGLRSDFISPSFKNEVAKAAKKQKLDVYVVVTRSESDTGENLIASGPLLVRKLWQNWHSDSSGFASSRAVVILMTGGQDGKLVSVGVRAGETLNGVGINRATMNDQNGPVKPVLKDYLVQSPAVVPVEIVNNISDLVAASGASVSSISAPVGEKTSSLFFASASLTMFMAGAFVLLLAAIWVALKRFQPVEKPAEEDFETRLRSSAKSFNEPKSSVSLTKSSTPTSKKRRASQGNNSSSSTSANKTSGTSSDGGDITPIIIASSCSSDSSHTSSHTSTSSHTPASSCSTTSHSCSSCSGGSSCGGGSCGGG
jgi:hypothetical protein